MIWKGNLPRQHSLQKVFAQEDPKEIMMYGTVTMNLAKENVVLDWASRMKLEEQNGELKVKEYQVYGVHCFYP